MIPYEDLCRALDRHKRKVRGEPLDAIDGGAEEVLLSSEDGLLDSYPEGGFGVDHGATTAPLTNSGAVPRGGMFTPAPSGPPRIPSSPDQTSQTRQYGDNWPGNENMDPNYPRGINPSR